MKIKIVCWGTENEMFNTIDERGLYEVHGDECKKNYHLIDGNKVEVITLGEKFSLLYKECSLNVKSDMTAVIINYDAKKKSEIIKKIRSINKNIMILEKCNDIRIINNDDYYNTKYVHFLKEGFNVNSVFYFILDNYDNDIIYGLAGVEKNEISHEDLIREILKNLCRIKDYKKVQLNLYLKNIMGIEQLSYMEDILKEYIVEDSMLIIKQSFSKNMDNEIYFNLNFR